MSKTWVFGEDGRWRTNARGATLIIEQRDWGNWHWYVTVDECAVKEGASATLTEARADVAAAAAGASDADRED
ncbi:MAG: hypothetical protein WCO00_10200 [Rhodospirillaceae bacterium]